MTIDLHMSTGIFNSFEAKQRMTSGEWTTDITDIDVNVNDVTIDVTNGEGSI